MHSFLSIICSLALLCNVGVFSVGVASDNNSVAVPTSIEERTFEVLNAQMEELESDASQTQALTLDAQSSGNECVSISTVKSFSGSEYILAEYAPAGYIIFDADSGTFLEGSAVADSPYRGITGEKYYGGPNEYYVAEEENSTIVYTHTIYNDVLADRDVAAYENACDELDSLLLDNPNTAVQSYINDGTISDSVMSLSEKDDEGFTCVANYEFFIKLTSCGYTTINGSGICGYIAAGMLLTYDAVTNSLPVVSSSYYSVSSTGVCTISTSLPKALYNVGVSLGYGTSTTSVAIHYTVEKYLQDMGVTASHTSLYSPIANNISIRNKIKADRPVIWFGSVTSNSFNSKTNINHAVVLYGYKSSYLLGTSYVAHFGWNRATQVTFSGIMGSMYTYTVTSY